MGYVTLMLMAFALAGCATSASDYSYAPMRYSAPPAPASHGAQAALDQCRAQSNMVPAMANAAANPFFAAASQQQYVVDCMRAAGYQIQ